MDEVVLSSEHMEVEEGRSRSEKKERGRSSSGVERWERFLARMALRVLLVEADDSTRQIIAALLRKCSYRVAAVADGLKAWEVLKERPHNIDLILTEVELPSVSGYALLSLIMEHEICRNIPVIMMSSHDSVSTVYKCMLRGASDYLVKPIRINELRNLWQHVWRRQSSNVSNHPQDESVAQQKVDASSETNAASNHSSDRACVQRNKECMEKGSEAQSSCTKPDLEEESAHRETIQDNLQPNQGKPFLCNVELQKYKMFSTGDSMDNATAPGKDFGSETCRRDTNIASEASDNNDEFVNSSRKAAGSIGAFSVSPNCRYGSPLSCGVGKFDSSPHLDLTLRRSPFSGFDNQSTEGRKTLKQSDSSAFTRYVNKTLQQLNPTSAKASNRHEDFGTDSEKQIDNAYKSESLHPTLGTQKVILSLATGQSEQTEAPTSCPEQSVFPVPVQLRGMQFDNVSTSYGPVFGSMFNTQSGLSPFLSPTSAIHQEPSFRIATFHQSNIGNSNPDQILDQKNHSQEPKLNSFEGGQVSPVTDQSASGSFCNGAITRLNSVGYGSICRSGGSTDPAEAMKASAEMQDCGNPHKSSQREAALYKFRLKRKERCYGKKVRYESRKKLAEQRPRVKGQFVRHVPVEPSPEQSEYQHLDS